MPGSRPPLHNFMSQSTLTIHHQLLSRMKMEAYTSNTLKRGWATKECHSTNTLPLRSIYWPWSILLSGRVLLELNAPFAQHRCFKLKADWTSWFSLTNLQTISPRSWDLYHQFPISSARGSSPKCIYINPEFCQSQLHNFQGLLKHCKEHLKSPSQNTGMTMWTIYRFKKWHCGMWAKE